MNDSMPSIWEKIDLAEYAEMQEAARSGVRKEENEVPETRWKRIKNRGFWWALKIVSALFWIYVPMKIFVGDVDRWIVDNVAPSMRWTLDYRFFIFLVILAILLLFFRRLAYLGAVVYILFFPLIVVLFYIPRFLARQRTWIPTVGLMHIAWLTFRSIRFTVVSGSVFALSVLVIVLDGPRFLQSAAVATLLVIWTILLGRACLSAVRPVSFIQRQQHTVTKVIDSKVIQTMAAPAANHLRPEVVKLSKTEVDQVVTNASFAVCVYAAGYFLADHLERYRKSGAAVVFSVLGIAILFVQAIVIFAIANQGVFNVSPSQFTVSADPSFAMFVRYSLNSMAPGEINAIQPSGDVATWISTYAGASVGGILLTLVLSLVFSIRSAREDEAAEAAISGMRERSDVYAARLVTEYGLPLEDLVLRLMNMGGLLNLWVRFISQNIGKVRREITDGSS